MALRLRVKEVAKEKGISMGKLQRDFPDCIQYTKFVKYSLHWLPKVSADRQRDR